jgi:Type I phosphodiesterase / nucleotide pyrophosphatase
VLADPVTEARRGVKRVLIKIGVSVWVREFFTLSGSRDIYRGVSAIYINYLDYDVFAHAYGPEHPRAVRSLRRIDKSIRALARAVRRVPEYGYDLYVLSDHGQTHCVPVQRLNEGHSLEQVLFDEVFTPGRPRAVRASRRAGGRFFADVRAFRTQHSPGLLQRFVNYLDRDFPWALGEEHEARERDGVRIISAGPNAFIYFLDTPAPLAVDAINARYPGLVEELSRRRDIGFVLARSAQGPVCGWGGKRFVLSRGDAGPFTGRPDLEIVLGGINDLMAMESAGDLVIYGTGAPAGNVSYVPEIGAHAGPTPEELHAFILAPTRAPLPSPLTHPTQLYPCFMRYHEIGGTTA